MDNKIKNMSSGKALRIYLDIIDGFISYGSDEIIYLNYPGGLDIFDSYRDLIWNVKYNLNELKKEGVNYEEL